MVRRLEWWPEYERGPLWEGATTVSPDDLGLPPDLAKRIEGWSSRYNDDRLPVDGPGDSAWLQEGSALLKEVRRSLGERVQVVVREPWWGVPDEDFEQPAGPG